MIKNIVITPYIYSGIVHNHTSFPTRYKLFSADCETYKGEPLTLQLYDGNVNEDVSLFWVNRGTILDVFLEYITDSMMSGTTNVVYFHNLAFDLGVLLIQYHREYIGRRSINIRHKCSYGKYKGREYVIDAVITTPCFATIRIFNEDGKHTTSVKLLDSLAFVHGSLDNVSRKLNLKHKKLGKPEGLGDTRFTEADSYFVKYAKNDVLVQYDLAVWITEQFKRYRTRFCVSIAQFASRVFKHFYVKSFEVIKLPPKPVVEGSILSYHGGKNSYNTDGITIVEDCVEIDITSAYPYAMRSIPNMIRGSYRKIEGYAHSEHEGIWCISGYVRNCKYPLLFDHTFKPLREGYVSDVWTTSYELSEAIRCGEFIPDGKKCFGWVWIPDKKYRHNPLAEYVEDFFSKKNSSTNESERLVYKLLLNSLYGKFIQSIEVDSGEPDLVLDTARNTVNKREHIFRAGGLFNPFIATLITGFTRVHLHSLEHRFSSFHASTDSVKMLGKNYVPHPNPKSLGGYELVVRGVCIMLRNKLYLHFDENGELKKYALHGFTGSCKDLMAMIRSGSTRYTIRHILRVKEALRRKDKLTPLASHDIDKAIKIDFSRIRYIDRFGNESFITHSELVKKYGNLLK